MPELLLGCVQRYLKDPKVFETKLSGRSVLLYEPSARAPTSQDELEDDENDFRFKTGSGATASSIGRDQPTVTFLEKTKDNAFQRRITLGRTANNDIEIDAQSVSRFHAWFVRDETTDLWAIVDAGSRNGTLVSGKRLTARVQTPLANAARIRVGNVELTYFLPDGFVAHLRTNSGR